ncbi:Hydroxyproline-rich glyco family [Olea europaea subsp. europaea]|uniref:Hydroxyproline-rich glyco family n=1 Tax=Olea europaea subsp. europaea TaxID=158383 RepID=A0A8S0VNS2_OLEEU|nr:Hydroxyproline-rich glyco family [Olea europaea subsp. europaea]
MESSTTYRAHGEASRPFLGFPLGTALLLIIIFSLSGIFSCCYHWEKLRSFRRSFSNLRAHDDDQGHSKPKINHMSSMEQQKESLPVLMPGDNFPKFIALPCPHRPPAQDRFIVEIQKPTRIAVPSF